MVATIRLCEKLSLSLALPENVDTVAGIEFDLHSGVFDPACMSVNQVYLLQQNVHFDQRSYLVSNVLLEADCGKSRAMMERYFIKF